MPDFEADVEMDEAPVDSDSPEDQEVDEAVDDESDAEETPGDEEDTDVEEDEDEDEDESTEDAPASGRSPAFEKLLAKYGGDHDKMADAYFEQANSTAAVHRELQELKEMLAAKKDEDPKAAEEFIKNDPYVKEVQEEVASVTGEVQRIQQEQYGLIAAYTAMEKEITSLEGELKRADEVDSVGIRQDLSEKRGTLKDTLREFNGNKRELGQLSRALRGYDRQLRDAEAQARTRMDNENKARQTAEETGRLASKEFDSALTSEAKRYGLKSGSQQFQFVRTIIKDRLINHMKQMDPDDEAIDMADAVEFLMGEAAENLGLKARFQKVSNMKRSATTPQRKAKGTAPGKKPPTDKTGKYWSIDHIHKRAEKLLG